MNFDRNTVIGFIALGILFVGFFWYTSNEQAKRNKQVAQKQAYDDSVKKANAPKIDTVKYVKDSLRNDSAVNTQKAGQFTGAANTPEQMVVVENDLLKITFSTKGGQPKKVELKKFKGRDSNYVRLASTDFDKIDYKINTGNNSSAAIKELNFSKIDSSVSGDGAKTIAFTLGDSTGKVITHQYVVYPGKYMIDFNISMKGASQLLEKGNMNLTWQYKAVQQESDITLEKTNTQVGYIMDGDFDYHTIGRTSDKEFDKPVKWLGIRQRFFNTFLVAKNNFQSGKIEWTIPADSTHVIMASTANMKYAAPGNDVTIPFNIFYGPSDYKTLKTYKQDFEDLVNLGQGPYYFVRPLNKYVILPLFDLIKGFVGSYGLVIALLTLIIRLIISPLTYGSYLSGAKMKVLRPEIAKLKEKYGGDQQQMSMEQMKLFREAGVNPLGGCIPALLQIPIFFALYSFFNSNVDLRGQSFLWANDLSAFDDVIKFGHIPVISSLLGNHLSLFTITAVVTSFLISLYSMSMSPDQSNPMMKYMPYIFPVFMLFIFNKLPSALTWYYTVSNIITLLLQFVIQNYIIDHDKILAKMEANRKKPKSKSKWQERLEQMQEQQKKMKDMQNKK